MKNKPVNYYVTVNGCDEWSGSLSEPDKTGKDGPFATLRRAVEEARRCDGETTRKIAVRGGTYYDVSIEFNSADSGLTIEAWEGEKPVLYGGRRISGWKKEGTGGFWYADLPEVVSGSWDFRLLVVNGRLCRRSRLPQNGEFTHLTVFDVEWMSTSAGGWARKPTEEELTTLEYRGEDLGPWLDINNAEVTVFHKWDESLAGVASIDLDKHILKLSNPCGHPPGSFKNSRYAVLNIREGMKEPGQWYLDRTAGRLVYWPLPGEDMEKAEVMAPTGSHIFEFAEKVCDMTFKGLELALTNTPLVAAEFAAVRMPGAVQSFEGLLNCRFEGLTIRHAGGHGMKFFGSSRSLTVENCVVFETGAGGILLQNNMREVEKNGVEIMEACLPTERIPDQPDCRIVGNYVHHIGILYSSAIAISAHCCHVLHNEVSDTPYTGISYGPFTNARCGGRSARIENNLISRVMQVLNDGAAIYATFSEDGIMRRNVVRDIQQGGDLDSIRNALYLDEMTAGWLLEENLVVNCSHPVLNHMARFNTIANNIFISDTYLKMNFIRCKDYTVKLNVIYSKDKVIFKENPDAIRDFGSNLAYSLIGEYEEHLIDERYRHYGTAPLEFRDGTLAGNPLFRDADGGNYELSPESPALRLGIRNIDVSKAGRLGF